MASSRPGLQTQVRTWSCSIVCRTGPWQCRDWGVHGCCFLDADTESPSWGDSSLVHSLCIGTLYLEPIALPSHPEAPAEQNSPTPHGATEFPCL